MKKFWEFIKKWIKRYYVYIIPIIIGILAPNLFFKIENGSHFMVLLFSLISH